jgi:16S rRNA (cytosine1402-N4)-methyltransferase
MGEHQSVLLEEAVNLLNVIDGKTYVDLTLGRAGHSSLILKNNPSGFLYCFDIDEEAIEESRPKLAKVGSNFEIIRENFANAKEALLSRGVEHVDGILMDLGVSSPQFDEEARGFSYRSDGPLDMRMDERNPLTAAKIINSYSYEELKNIFRKYGEDPDSAAVSKAICLAREKKPILTCQELVGLIKEAKPARSLAKKGHPAKQIFQALRIEVNDELGNLHKALNELPSLLNPDGTLVIISFQSLEDREVKDCFHNLTTVEGTRYGPASISKSVSAPFVNVLRHPLEPTEEEITINHRAKSAKMRAIRRKE